MSQTRFPRLLLAAGAALLLLALALALIGAPGVARAGGGPPGVEPQPPLAAGVLCFVKDGMTTCVERSGIQSSGTLTDQVRSLMQALVAGPTLAEQSRRVRSALPAGARLVDVRLTGGRAVIRFDLPATFLATFDAGDAEDANEQIATTLTLFNFARIDVEARDPAQPGAYRPLSSFLAPVIIPHKPGELPTSTPPNSAPGGQPPQNGRPQSSGGLAGKSVFVSAGHGWYWSSIQGRYRTQRPVYPSAPYPAGEGIVEDFNNAEVVNQYLLQYLWNAGADAWTVRERDMNLEMHIVDDVSSAFSLEGAWLTAGSGGYSPTNVLSGTYRYATSVTSGATATATWTFTPSDPAEYAVYVWFPHAADRAAAARYSVEHAGGTTVVTITQQRDEIDWRYIGTYPFRSGAAGRVRLTNQSTTPGQNVLADAVRIGGGIGDQIVGGAPTPSGKPRWEDRAWSYAKWVGLPDVENLNDVIARPIFAEWEYEPGEDAVFVSWHTNGATGYTTIRGTESYSHSFEPTPLSDRLQYWVHTELINDIHAGWDAAWPDRGLKSKDLGELRLLDTLPGVLIENGFHDNPQDVEAMKDPRFNLLSARAVYQGLVRYWHEQNSSVPLVFLPEPPTHLSVRNSGPAQVTLAWQPGPTDGAGLLGDAATSYRVYTSTDGFGWGDALETASTTLTLSGLPAGQVVYVQVAGVNAGGESFPTPVLAARVVGSGVAPVLIVYGFDRIDRLGVPKLFDPTEGNSRRMLPDMVNRYDYIIQHAAGITWAFDSAVHASVTDGGVGLGNYTIVDWISGEDQWPDVVLNATDQSLLQSFLDTGGALLISGSEIGFDLEHNGFGKDFYNNVLHAQFSADDAGVYLVGANVGGIFHGLGAFSFDDGTHGTYDADWPDVFVPLDGAQAALVYDAGGAAALSYAGGPCTRLIYLGFPLETVYPNSTRDQLLSRAMSFLGACLPSDEGPDTSILSPADGAAYNTLPPFNGTSNATSAVQVAILSGTTFYDGSSFVPAETWLTALGTSAWSHSLPALPDGDYGLRARAVSGVLSDTTPASVTFQLDTLAPTTPVPITPTGGVSIAVISPTLSWSGGGDPAGFDLVLDGVTETLNGPALGVTRVVTEGVHTWRVRAFDRAGNYSDWSALATFSSFIPKVYLPLIGRNYTAETPPAPMCYDALDNGGFELGLAGWTVMAANPPPAVVVDPVYSGAQSIRIGSGVTTTGAVTQFGFSSVQQAVAIPANALSAHLQFQRYRVSGDTDHDLQYVAVLSGTSVLDYLVYEITDDPVWLAAEFDLLAYAGQRIDIRFSVRNDGTGGATGMYIDGASLRVCVPLP